VSPLSSIVIGAVAGVVCYSACQLKPRFGYDDSLDVVGVHCVGGTTGAILTGLFAEKAVNAAGADGLFFGNPGQLVTQLIAVGTTLVYCGVGAFILFKIVDVLVGLRVAEEQEVSGLDLSQHGESAYTFSMEQNGDSPH
jgi:Amt family ammonium transporter